MRPLECYQYLLIFYTLQLRIRVAVVDDQALGRGGFAMVLEHQDDIDVVAEVGTGREAIEVARSHRPDVIVPRLLFAYERGSSRLATMTSVTE